MIPREQQIEQSVQDFLRTQLESEGYIPDVLDLRDSFPSFEERGGELVKSQIATGFVMDPGGRLMELGSDLTQKSHTIEFWTFGTDHDTAQNIAFVIRALIEDAPNALIPLKDVGQEGQPVIDQLQVDDERRPVVQRQVNTDPRPWDLFVWSTTVRVIDTYYPSLVN